MWTIWGKLAELFKNFQYERYRTSGQTLRVSKTITGIAKAILSQSEIEIVKLVLESIWSQGSEPWWVVWQKVHRGPSKNGNFQVVSCSEDSSGQVVMALASFYFTASAWDKCWVWFDYSSTNVNFFKAIVSTLYEDVYHQVQPILINLVITWIPSLVI